MLLTLGRWLTSCLLVSLALGPVTAGAGGIEDLGILSDSYPRAFFFRSSEQAYNERRFPDYDSWARQFDRLQGIMGKCLNEECVGREPRNIQFFSRFKREHPQQVVLLHFNGNARDPRYLTNTYFPGHWIYRAAIEITGDVPADAGDTVIHVKDARGFRLAAGRYHTSADDIALFAITGDASHDWDHCEQVQLTDVDETANTITVKRGCYGTQPLAFRAGQSRAAAHMVEGPWGKSNHILWYYNYTLHCPRDRDGKSCADRLVDDLAEWFGPGGKLSAFDGLEFDVLHHQTRGDTDGDGVEDDGVIDGVNQYGIGVIEFVRQLRERLTDSRIIQADGALGAGGVLSQRAWGWLNGIESEGFPNLNDWEFADWSGGLNRHFFWLANGRPPAFGYVNHKWNESVPGKPGIHVPPQVPFSRHRLALAACQFFDAATCFSFAPPQDPDGRLGVWDELRQGVNDRTGWLGRPAGPAVRLAAVAPDLLNGEGLTTALANRIWGPVTARPSDTGVEIVAVDPEASQLRFEIRGIPADGPNVFLSIEMQGAPLAGYPPEMARFAQVGVSGGVFDLLANEPVAVGARLRGAKQECPLDEAPGASLARRSARIGGEVLPAYFVHPPHGQKTGYTYWSTDVDVPLDSEVHFSLGMGELSPQRSDGVQFRVTVAEVAGETIGPEVTIFDEISNQHQWLPRSPSLAPYAGKRIRLKFIADCGPQDNSTTDHAYWGDVKLVKAGATIDNTTPLVQSMTWINHRPFRSGFSFRHVRTDEIDVSFAVEGSQPVTLNRVTAHAHPDVIDRVFEHGIVLANPSRTPYTFDLATLSPGRSYRRIQAVSTQDVTVNNGQAVGTTVTLGERDALFLVRTD